MGKLVLNRNPVNYFAEVEQMAYDPSNMPPGIEPSPDKMLQVSYNAHKILPEEHFVCFAVYESISIPVCVATVNLTDGKQLFIYLFIYVVDF